MQMDYGHRLPFVKLMTATSFLHLHHNENGRIQSKLQMLFSMS